MPKWKAEDAPDSLQEASPKKVASASSIGPTLKVVFVVIYKHSPLDKDGESVVELKGVFDNREAANQEALKICQDTFDLWYQFKNDGKFTDYGTTDDPPELECDEPQAHQWLTSLGELRVIVWEGADLGVGKVFVMMEEVRSRSEFKPTRPAKETVVKDDSDSSYED